MARKVFSKKQKEEAVLRALSKRETVAQVAQAFGIDEDTLRRWCREAGHPLGAVPEPVGPRESATEPGKAGQAGESPQGEETDRLKKARLAANLEYVGKIPQDKVDAAAKLADFNEQKFAVDTINGMKGTIVLGAAPFLGLNPAWPECQAISKLSDFAESQVRLNAMQLSPWLREHCGGNVGLAVCGLALCADVVFTGFAIFALAQAAAAARAQQGQAAPPPQKKPEQQNNPAHVPPPAQEKKPEGGHEKPPEVARQELQQKANNFWKQKK